MSKVWAVIRREFEESVRTKTFVLGTVFGPIIMIGLLVVPALFLRAGAMEREIVVVYEGDGSLAEIVAAALTQGLPGQFEESERGRWSAQAITGAARDAEVIRARLEARLAARDIDGYLWLPAGATHGDTVEYVGRNAGSLTDMAITQAIVQAAVQRERMAAAGIDAAAVAAALGPVQFESRRTAAGRARGSERAIMGLAYILGFMTYTVMIIWGMAVQRGVLEEKRDRIVEVVVSSIQATDLMLGKVLGIGAAGVLQMMIWVAFAVGVFLFGENVVMAMGGQLPELPQVPLAVAVIFVAFFAGGCLTYMSVFASLGAIATTDQEAQQLVLPAMVPIFLGFIMMMAVMDRPDAAVAVVGSMIPFTAPLVMPVRVLVAEVPTLEILLAWFLLMFTGLAMAWTGGKIYRIGILATGKRPSMAEVWRWLRTA